MLSVTFRKLMCTQHLIDFLTMILRHWAFCSQSSWITECVEINSRDFNVCIVQIRNFTLYYILNFSIHNFYCIVLKILDRYLLYLILLLKNKWKTKQTNKKPEYFFPSPILKFGMVLLLCILSQFFYLILANNLTLSAFHATAHCLHLNLQNSSFLLSSAKQKPKYNSKGKARVNGVVLHGCIIFHLLPLPKCTPDMEGAVSMNEAVIYYTMH